MDIIPSEAIISWFLNHGPFAGFALIFIGLYLWERKGRAQDRKDFDVALKQAQDEHIETLKIVTPLAQKFTDTMDVILPLAMAQLNRRAE